MGDFIIKWNHRLHFIMESPLVLQSSVRSYSAPIATSLLFSSFSFLLWLLMLSERMSEKCSDYFVCDNLRFEIIYFYFRILILIGHICILYLILTKYDVIYTNLSKNIDFVIESSKNINFWIWFCCRTFDVLLHITLDIIINLTFICKN